MKKQGSLPCGKILLIMKQLYLTTVFILFNLISFGWGATGHRVVGEIAWQHLNPKAKKNVQRILGNESLAICSNWMDFIKSEPSYDSLKPWHYCTMPEAEIYSGPPAEGDIIMAIEKFMNEFRTKKFSVNEAFALKCLVHLVGDLHQPLHVGNGLDKGGNDVKLEYMWQKTNLHRIWDDDMIEQQRLGYKEYVEWINYPTKDQIKEWQSTTVMQWAFESRAVHTQIYNYPESGKLSYRYTYDNIDLLNQRLLQGGVRLAGILNELLD